MLIKYLSFLVVLSAFHGVEAQTINAASCSSTDVQVAINAASPGDTVLVPAGSCAWSNVVTIAKAITLQGAGAATSGTTCGSGTASPVWGNTNINVTGGNHSIHITKQAGGAIRIQGLNFWASNVTGRTFYIDGAWSGTQPVIFQNTSFCGNNSWMGEINTPGGVILSHTYTAGTYNNGGGWTVVDDANTYNSWRTADTMGSKDTNGLLNFYIEDSTFHTGNIIDCDSGCRVVVRYNTMQFAAFNSHGYDTSPYGMRHFEIYNNTFTDPNPSEIDQQGQYLGNVQFFVWLRGGTGVVYNNHFDEVAGRGWGDKPIVRQSMYALSDPTLLRSHGDSAQSSCSTISYPIQGDAGQLGQNWTTGTGFFTDPIYFWGNIRTPTPGAWLFPWQFDSGSPQTCVPNLDLNIWMQSGRDVINTGLSGGSAKPGYTPYTYPHPLTQGLRGSGGGGTPATPPTALQAVVH